jgi:hypothetical protein
MTDCEKKLRRMVDGIAEDVVQGRMRFFPNDESVVDDMNGETVYEVYNTKYIIGDDGSFHDVMLMLAGGGPVIWLDTWSQEIRGAGVVTSTQSIFMTMTTCLITGMNSTRA